MSKLVIGTPAALSIRLPTKDAMKPNSIKYRYYERGARPVNVKYFEKHVLIAAPKLIAIPPIQSRN